MHHITRIQTIFASAVGLILVALFVTGVTWRTEELAILSWVERGISAAGFRTQLAMGDLNGAAAVGGAFNSQTPAHATGTASAVPVLVYHGIVSSSDRFSLTQEKFKDQLFALKRAGYQTVSVADFLAFTRGEKELPAKSFLLTFDDGRADSFERGDPVLAALGYTAVMYVSTEASLDSPAEHSKYYLAKEELARMQQSGRWEIGSHARQVGGGFIPIGPSNERGNFLSNRKWLPEQGRLETREEYALRIDDELGTAQTLLKEAFNTPVISFSYPFGDYGQQQINEPQAESIINAAMKRYYQLAFEQVWPGDARFSMNYPGDDPYHFRRIEVDTEWSGEQLLSFLAGATARPLPHTETFSIASAWKHNWGIVTMRDSSIILDAQPGSTGALAFLDGTGGWTDYRYTVNARMRMGTTVGLISRYRDEGTMISCTFSDHVLRLKEQRDGVTRVIVEKAYVVPQEAELSMSVAGARAECAVDGTTLLTGSFNSTHAKGGIGVTIWDETLGTGSATISNLRVEPI